MERIVAPLKSFESEGQSQPISFVSTVEVSTGVQCDVYEFEDKNKDLGIILKFPLIHDN